VCLCVCLCVCAPVACDAAVSPQCCHKCWLPPHTQCTPLQETFEHNEFRLELLSSVWQAFLFIAESALKVRTLFTFLFLNFPLCWVRGVSLIGLL